MLTKDIKVGSIVALRTHPFNQGLTSVILAGDPSAISPLMIVIEVLKDSKTTHDEHSGNELTNSEIPQCKCIWYSHKTGAFDEQWISGKLLKVINPDTSNIEFVKPTDLSGKIVALKTVELEMGKVKSSYSLDYTDGETASPKTNHSPILHYVSPIMQIVEVRKNETKDLKYDVKSGDPRRVISSFSVKCKWYNTVDDKLSEKFIPIEALSVLPIASEKILTEIHNDITVNSPVFYRYDRTIIRPLKIVLKSGKYYLRAFEYISNSFIEIEITKKLTKASKPVIDKEPKLKSIFSPALRSQNFKSLINNAIRGKNFVRIKYKDDAGKMTVRSVSKFKIENNTHLVGHCHLRNEERYFSIEQIQQIQQLDIVWSNSK